MSVLAPFELRVRGQMPGVLSGSLFIPTSRRAKDRALFSRWHDAATDLIRLDLTPGRPGSVRASILAVDPFGLDLEPDLEHTEPAAEYERMAALDPAFGPATQPNHGVNLSGDRAWATNLLFGAPLEVDLVAWKARRLLRYVVPSNDAPRVTGTAHFAFSLDRRYVYLQQSLLSRDSPARSVDLTLARIDNQTGAERVWRIAPPPAERLEFANFHSAFYWEEGDRRFVGLLRTGALIEGLAPHRTDRPHRTAPMAPSAIWSIELRDDLNVLTAQLLPGIEELDVLALSHLDVDASSRDGFVLFANAKEAPVGEETHGPNAYDEQPHQVTEHYPGMTVEALNIGLVLRYERRHGRTKVTTFRRAYDPGRPSRGHSWLPINIELDLARQRLFCSFSGFRPRLVPLHVAEAYRARLADLSKTRYVPPLLMRFDARTLDLDDGGGRDHLSYAEPMALAVAGRSGNEYVCTFSPEAGLRVYPADDLTRLIAEAEAPQLTQWGDTHFRPEPAHMQFRPA